MRIVMRITQSAPTEHLQRLDCILLGSFRAIGTSILILVIRLVSRQRPAIYLNKLLKTGTRYSSQACSSADAKCANNPLTPHCLTSPI